MVRLLLPMVYPSTVPATAMMKMMIADVRGENAYNISRHIKVLRTSGLLYEKKENGFLLL